MADTMQMGGQSCAVLYVDAGIGGGAGDGSTPAVALANIPAVGSLASNTVYLCRRTLSNAITMTSGTLATGNHIYLVGMPKSTDWLYERAPAAAKAAWDADADDYALANTSAYNTQFQLNPIDNAGFHRLKITRVSPTSGNGYSRYDSTLQLDVRANYPGTDYQTNGMFFFTNNWWCDAYAKALSDPTWLTNTSYASGGMSFQFARSLKFCNNHIEYNHRYNNTAVDNWSTAVYAHYIQHLTANDNEFWVSSGGSNGNNFYCFTMDSLYSQAYAEFCRNNGYWVCQDYTYASVWTMFSLTAKDIYSRDVNITVDRYYNRSGITNGSYIAYGYVTGNGGNVASCPGKWDIQNITVDSGDLGYIGGYLVYLYYYVAGYTAYSAPYTSSIIKNISAKAPSTGAIASSYSGTACYIGIPVHFSPVENLTAWHYMSTGIYLNGAANDRDNVIYLKGPVYKNVDVKGMMSIYQTSYVDIASWTLGSAPGTQKLNCGCSNIYIRSATIDPGSAWGSQQWLYWYRSYGRVLIDAIDVSPYVTWNSTPGYDDAVLINDVNNVADKWWGSDYYYTGITNAAYRTGGAATSVRFTGTVSDVHWTHLEMALPPFRGLEWTPGSTGAATATLHVAHKSMTNPTYLQKRIKLLVQVPYYNSDTGLYDTKTYLSDVDGQVLDDSASTWNGDSGLTQVKIVVPFAVTTAGQVVTVRLFYDWYDATGYCYIDPLVEFTI